MNWYRHHWQYVGLVVAAAVGVYLAVAWGDLNVMQRILLASWIVLLLHEAEEWAWPGGEPAILNSVVPGFPPIRKLIGAGSGSAHPDRYPSNANSAMVVNVFAAYPIYLVAAIFSHQIWLGLFAAFFFWLGQLMFHGVITNRQLGSVYNPGLATTIVGLALGIYYVWHVESTDLASGWDWLGAVVCLVAFMVLVMIKLTFTWLADENSPYVFTEYEMNRWNVQARIARHR